MDELFNNGEVYNRYRIKNDMKTNLPLPSTGHLVKAGESIVVPPHVITEHMMSLLGRDGITITGVSDDEYKRIQEVSANSNPANKPMGVPGNSEKKAEKSGS